MLFRHYNQVNTKWLVRDLKKAQRILSKYSGGYSGEHASAEDFLRDLIDRTTKIESGDLSVIDELWGWFAPTCQWDDFVGDIELGERIFQKLNRIKKKASS